MPSIIFQGENEDQVCTEYIELFFKHLVKIPELKGFEVVEKFLEFTDRKDFLKYLNEWYSSNKTMEISEMIHEDGVVNVHVTSELMTFFKNTNVFARQDREALDKYY